MWTLTKKDSFQEIAMTIVWAFVAWLIWSVFILLLSIFIWNYTNLFTAWWVWTKFGTVRVEPIYPIMMSLITLVWTTITSILTYLILGYTNPESYKKNFVIFSQIFYLQILIYICITPIYLIFWWTSFDNVIITNIIHVLIVIFWINLLLDILNNYRYVLIWIYWTFIWTFLTSIIAILIYYSFPSWNSKITALILLVPTINTLIIALKKVFELWYFHFYRLTWTDPIWDIFYKIKREDEEKEKEESIQNFN